MSPNLKFNIADNAFMHITYLVEQKGLSYIEAITQYSTDSGIEIEAIAEMIQKNAFIKSQVEIEAEKLKYLKKQDRLEI